MTQRLRFLLDTNVLIPLQDSSHILELSLANLVRLANFGGHQLLYHGPATKADFLRDPDKRRSQSNLNRLSQYIELSDPPICPWNSTGTTDNDGCDNEILHAVESDAVHALVTEDRGIHAKARVRGLQDRVYTIQLAEDWLRRLHESRDVVLPNVDDVPLYGLTGSLAEPFFDSLRAGYQGFDAWFRKKARDGRRAWVCREDSGSLGAVCVYAMQESETINDAGDILRGRALKLCTFKVDERFRGRKTGELFLKASFRYASENACEHIFIHAHPVEQDYLIRLLEDFGFQQAGTYERRDVVLVKSHPRVAPLASDLHALDYVRRYFPHYRADESVGKFIVPIQPQYHAILFPELEAQGNLFGVSNVGNAIKLAYLCHSRVGLINPGDVLLFYRTHDAKAVTSVGIVELHETSEDAAKIATLVRRRTVYSLDEIRGLATKPTKVILFRLIRHLDHPVSYDWLKENGVVTGPIQTIRRISHEGFASVVR